MIFVSLCDSVLHGLITGTTRRLDFPDVPRNKASRLQREASLYRSLTLLLYRLLVVKNRLYRIFIVACHVRIVAAVQIASREKIGQKTEKNC